MSVGGRATERDGGRERARVHESWSWGGMGGIAYLFISERCKWAWYVYIA